MKKTNPLPRYKVHVKKGQEVIIITGANKKQKGKVLEVLTKKTV
jgi:ribosomal protein L24